LSKTNVKDINAPSSLRSAYMKLLIK